MNDLVKNRQRQYIRIKLEELYAYMAISEVKGRPVKTKHKQVIVEHIGVGGLKFISDLKLPVHSRILLEFVLEIGGQRIELYGCVVRRLLHEKLYEYGVEFITNRIERLQLMKWLNELVLELCPASAKIHRMYMCISDPYSVLEHHKIDLTV